MSTVPFGTPQPVGGTTDTGTTSTAQHLNGAAQTPAQAAPEIDINDPRLTSEILEVNIEGDAYAQPTPPPDGKYRVKLKLVQVDDGKGGKADFKAGQSKGQVPQTYLSTSIEARILDPSGKYDNIPVFDYWVSTFVDRQGSSKIQTILSNITKPDGSPWLNSTMRLTGRQWMDMFVKALSAEPEVGIETQWGWSCQPCGELADKAGDKRPREVLGMNKFPQDISKSKGGVVVFQPEMKCSVNAAHGYNRAQVRIARFLSLKELAGK